ncbi:hypothetical protein BDA96_10G004500 [Sorghum bicolor]|uniref:Uncharacterized protein n=1 Tax=Sorghum bicolor TaxID=4558 RepID=A0A921TZ28_SORBI|nr:hypothetical protein BDA96_10G004500 [Sorghum bicolor]
MSAFFFPARSSPIRFPALSLSLRVRCFSPVHLSASSSVPPPQSDSRGRRRHGRRACRGRGGRASHPLHRIPVLACPMLHSHLLPGFPVHASSPARSARPAPPWPPSMLRPRWASLPSTSLYPRPCVPDASLLFASRLPRPRLLPSQIRAAGAAMAVEHAAATVGEPPPAATTQPPAKGVKVPAAAAGQRSVPTPHEAERGMREITITCRGRTCLRPAPGTCPRCARPPPRRSRQRRASRCQRRPGRGLCPRLTRQSGGCGRSPSPTEGEPAFDRRWEPVLAAPP